MIFIDSSAFIAYYREAASNHGKAVALFTKIDGGELGEPVASDYVFDESVTAVMVRTKDAEKAVALGNFMLRGARLLKVHEHAFAEAWKLFKSNKAGFSFTDCTSLALMRLSGIREIATFDQAFKKAEGITVVE